MTLLQVRKIIAQSNKTSFYVINHNGAEEGTINYTLNNIISSEAPVAVPFEEELLLV